MNQFDQEMHDEAANKFQEWIVSQPKEPADEEAAFNAGFIAGVKKMQQVERLNLAALAEKHARMAERDGTVQGFMIGSRIRSISHVEENLREVKRESKLELVEHLIAMVDPGEMKKFLDLKRYTLLHGGD